MFRTALIRYGIPILLAISAIAYFGVPYVDRLLSDWFRADVDLRAQQVAHSVEAPLSKLLKQGAVRDLDSYLAKVTADERVLAIVLCDTEGKLIFKTELTPATLNCNSVESGAAKVGDDSSYLLPLESGSVEVSTVAFAPADIKPFRILIVHDLSFIDRRQSTARDDEDGVLILSTFAGASRELVEALLVNPFDVAETAAAIARAIDMPRDERRERMKLMRRTVKENNVYRWAGRMLMDVARIRQRQALPGKHATPWLLASGS